MEPPMKEPSVQELEAKLSKLKASTTRQSLLLWASIMVQYGLWMMDHRQGNIGSVLHVVALVLIAIVVMERLSKVFEK